MLVGTRYEKGHGNNSIYVRVRNFSNQFYNFVSQGWNSSESVGTKIFLNELPDSDPIDSLYAIDASLPSLESMQEIVDNTGLVIGVGVFTPSSVSGAGLTLAEIEGSTVLAKQATLQQTATWTQVDGMFSPMLDALTEIVVNTGASNSDMGDIADALMGSWEIVNKQMVFYRRDGSELMRFDLTDKLGNASEHNVFKRTKV
jgi:hypothetical protein